MCGYCEYPYMGLCFAPMTPIPIYDLVMACLRARAIPQRQVADGSGVAFSTVAKIAQGVVSDPSVHTVQRLHDYFLTQCPRSPALQGAIAALSQEAA